MLNITRREIDQVPLDKIDPQRIQLDPENHTVFLTNPGMKIDLVALAKGYSADLSWCTSKEKK